MWPLLVLGGLLVACGGGPERQDAEAYAAQMGPLLQENTELAVLFRNSAAAIKKSREGEDDAPGPPVSNMISNEVLPQAELLATSAAAIVPTTDALATAHEGLVEAWQTRHAGYSALAEAWTGGDISGLRGALDARLDHQRAEAAAFAEIDALLRAQGQVLELYPPGAGAR